MQALSVIFSVHYGAEQGGLSPLQGQVPAYSLKGAVSHHLHYWGPV